MAKIAVMHNGFTRELSRYGPERTYQPLSPPQARAYCSRLARTHYENFSVASALLPKRLRQPFHNVYAYCRWADDLADESGGGSRALNLLQWWREQLLTCYDGTPRHPVMVALRETIIEFEIPKQPFLDLLIAFEQDQTVNRYQTFDQLLGYCRYSANPVGRLVLYLCRSFDETRAGLSDHICTALQLANFWQDVARDYDIGRVYLPDETRRHHGYTDAALQVREYNPAFVELMRDLIRQTREMFQRGQPLVGLMPKDVQPDIALFVEGGLAILRQIERINYNVWHTRPEVDRWQKLALVGGVLWGKAKAALW